MGRELCLVNSICLGSSSIIKRQGFGHYQAVQTEMAGYKRARIEQHA